MVAALTQLLLERLDLEPPQLHADEVRDAIGTALPALLTLGVLRETIPATTATCWECGGSHVGRVTYISLPGSAERIPVLPCPACGSQRVSPDHLRRWNIDMGGFCDALAVASKIGDRHTEIVPGHLWKLGHATWASKPREVFLARNVSAMNRSAVNDSLSRHPRAIVFVPTEQAAQRAAMTIPNLALPLASLLDLGAEGFRFDRNYVESRLEDADVRTAAKPKRQSRKRASRTADIEKLVQEMKTHLKAAKDHAIETRDRTGTPSILPRPTCKDLAERVGMRPYNVTRCLKDPKAKELKLYWDTAKDLDHIMGYANRPGRPRET